ncbi:hypothetical protein ACFQ88_02935 [Paenibacillus sp. NPDC056579]|uniref:hypothetical protein n=1 Tax=unclassified Paenibacillus TaxID=185978 RepID=UPI001EF79454|nr:hypothetical protein [Paenibacillus sp. H1-7]ULL15979.1 hypothetical protein DVH26_16925 [Paenibacillus sp. H1-7]
MQHEWLGITLGATEGAVERENKKKSFKEKRMKTNTKHYPTYLFYGKSISEKLLTRKYGVLCPQSVEFCCTSWSMVQRASLHFRYFASCMEEIR